MSAVAILNIKYAFNGNEVWNWNPREPTSDTRDGILDLIKYSILDLLPPLMGRTLCLTFKWPLQVRIHQLELRFVNSFCKSNRTRGPLWLPSRKAFSFSPGRLCERTKIYKTASSTHVICHSNYGHFLFYRIVCDQGKTNELTVRNTKQPVKFIYM